MRPVLFQLAPQRSTQYSDLVSRLAPLEISLSPLATDLLSISPLRLGGLDYLRCDFGRDRDDIPAESPLFATTSGCFWLHEPGPGHKSPLLLEPIEPVSVHHFSEDLVTSRRYPGKTNELFTRLLINIARYSSDFSSTPYSELRLFDPLSGGGTTVFSGLMLGCQAGGVELNKKSASSTAVFLKHYLQKKRLPFTLREEQLKKIKASRWWFDITTSPAPTRCILARGSLSQAPELMAGFKRFHLIVCDLPYGTQHKGSLDELLAEGIPVWRQMLMPGGCLTFSWDATRYPRKKMIHAVEAEGSFRVLDTPPYDQLAHRVDRVIKRRDIIAARID